MSDPFLIPLYPALVQPGLPVVTPHGKDLGILLFNEEAYLHTDGALIRTAEIEEMVIFGDPMTEAANCCAGNYPEGCTSQSTQGPTCPKVFPAVTDPADCKVPEYQTIDSCGPPAGYGKK